MDEIRSRLNDLAESPSVPPAPGLESLRGRAKRASRRAPIVAGAMAVALTVTGVVAVARLVDLDGRESSTVQPANPSSWDHLKTPWVDGAGLHYRGRTVSQPNGKHFGAVTMTEDSAVVQLTTEGEEVVPDDQATEDPDAPEQLEEPTNAELILVPLLGAILNLTNELLGVAITDPAGRLVTWAEPILGGVRLVAFDTVEQTRIRQLQVADKLARVFAVDGTTAYVGTSDDFSVWDLAPTAPNRLTSLPAHFPAQGLIVDAHGDWAFATDGQTAQLVDPSGATIKSFDEGLLATFSPDGSHLAGILITNRPILWNRTTGAEVQLNLASNLKTVSLKWSTSGSLVVLTQALDPAGDELVESANYYSCDPPTGACTLLPSEGFIDYREVSDAGPSTQLFGVFGYPRY